MLSQKVPTDYLDKALERYYEYFKVHFDSKAQIYPSLKETLAQLRNREIDLAILTGANRKWAEMTLSESRLSSFFSVVMTSDELKVPKPDPGALTTIMRKFGADAGRTTYVGDEVKDVRTSRNAYVQAAGAFWGSWEREELRSAEPDAILNEPIELLTIVC